MLRRAWVLALLALSLACQGPMPTATPTATPTPTVRPTATPTPPPYPDLTFMKKPDESIDGYFRYIPTASSDNGITEIILGVVNQGEIMAPASTLVYSTRYKNENFPAGVFRIPPLMPGVHTVLIVNINNDFYIERHGEAEDLALALTLDYRDEISEGPGDGEYNNWVKVTFILDPQFILQ